MQQNQYDADAVNWTVQNRDPVVGSFDQHNNWADYDEYLFRDIKYPTEYLLLLDFGCGPGRNLVKYNRKFFRLDGVDISQKNIDNAKNWIDYNKCKLGKLYKNNGVDLADISSDEYDVVMSTICFQHICVYEIRKNFLREFYRVLQPKGILTMQMGFGGKEAGYPTAGYFENNYDALKTNSGCDTDIMNPDDLKKDLYEVGFKNFNYYVRPVGPGDSHRFWIFFNALKD